MQNIACAIVFCALLLDSHNTSRESRANAGWTVLIPFTMILWSFLGAVL